MATLLKSSVNGLCIGRGANDCTGTTAIGILALQGIANVINRGCFSTAVGYNALRCGGTANYGLRNTAVGYCAAVATAGGSCNTVIGAFAFKTNDTGLCNTGVGYRVLCSNTTGCYNTAFGSSALFSNTTGLRNTAIGYDAMGGATVTGNNNTAIGAGALAGLTTGSENTAVGFNASYRNTTGIRNTAFGANALCNNCIGSGNVAFGYASLKETSNSTGNATAFGSRAAQRINGRNNTAVGFKALYGAASSTGYNNTAVGACSLASISTGKGNVGFGSLAGRDLATGNFNTMFGHATVGSSNSQWGVMVGFKAGYGLGDATGSISIGSYAGAASSFYSSGQYPDIFIGYCAGKDITTYGGNTFVGAKAGFNLNLGKGNTAIGYKAGYLNTQVTARCNTFIGSCAYPRNVSGNFNYVIAVGYYSHPDATSYHTMWGASFNSVNNEIGSAWQNVSDCRDKTNIKDLNPKLGLEFIKRLRPVTFNWDIRDEYVRKCGFEYGVKDGTLTQEQEEYGYISQEIQSVLNELNIRWDAIGSNDKIIRLQSDNFHASHIKAIQELHQRVISLKERVTALA
jgi:hypothetical protein